MIFSLVVPLFSLFFSFDSFGSIYLYMCLYKGIPIITHSVYVVPKSYIVSVLFLVKVLPFGGPKLYVTLMLLLFRPLLTFLVSIVPCRRRHVYHCSLPICACPIPLVLCCPVCPHSYLNWSAGVSSSAYWTHKYVLVLPLSHLNVWHNSRVPVFQ